MTNASSASDPPVPSDRPDPASLDFEAATAELEAIIERIESGDIGLEASLAEWRRGGALVKRCRAVLDAAEQELLQADADGADDPGADPEATSTG